MFPGAGSGVGSGLLVPSDRRDSVVGNVGWLGLCPEGSNPWASTLPTIAAAQGKGHLHGEFKEENHLLAPGHINQALIIT